MRLAVTSTVPVSDTATYDFITQCCEVKCTTHAWQKRRWSNECCHY